MGKRDENCEFKNGQWYFPKGEEGKSREFWEDRTLEYEPEVKRADLKDNHIIELAFDRGMDEEEDGDDKKITQMIMSLSMATSSSK